MTTEIAVSNRLGIALATDSAVTISSGGRVKVFDTADKLFELSSIHPVGVMINGNMDCLGVPWEILVKDFRNSRGHEQRDHVKQWTADFLEYVEGHILISEEAISRYVDHVTVTEVEAVQSAVQDVMFRFIRTAPPRRATIQKALTQIIQDIMVERKNYLLEFPIATSLEETSVDKIIERYSEQIKKILIERFRGRDLDSNETTAMIEIVAESLRRSCQSDFAAGIVVAGFGEKEMFPALSAVEVDGRVLGRLKITDMENKLISGREDSGQVTYFAQTDVIQRLLGGVDPRFVKKTSEFIEKAVIKVAESIEKALRPRKISERRKQKREKAIRDIAEIVTKEYTDETAVNLSDEFSQEFDRMVAMMPKQELIELAEALISITAVERKASAEAATVGGPIDVAMITKHEGFVWIKRKHYFEKDLNARYFWRHFANPPIESLQGESHYDQASTNPRSPVGAPRNRPAQPRTGGRTEKGDRPLSS